MGNRAVITASKSKDVKKSKAIGVYVHWNGGRDSVEAFLKYCELKKYRSPGEDNFGWARLCQVIGNYFGGTDSVGIGLCEELDCDNYDNGVYIIKGWKIVGRQYHDGAEQHYYNLLKMLIDIDKAQPTKEQLGEERIKTLLAEEEKRTDAIFRKRRLSNE